MKTTELKAGFQSGKYAELLKDIYIDESNPYHFNHWQENQFYCND